MARDDRWGRTYESFGEDPALVDASWRPSSTGSRAAAGDLDRPDRVLATAKHYAGDGLTDVRHRRGRLHVDQGIDQVSRAEFDGSRWRRTRPAINKHHVGSVMPSFSSVDWTEDGLGNPVKMHANEELITDVLKGEIGFDGLVISDWRAIRQIPGDYRDQVQASVNAGVDMFMEPITTEQHRRLGASSSPPSSTLVEAGEVPMSRIDDAVSRILTAKFELGLFEHPFTDRRNIDTIGSKAHREVARRAVAESQVLLKNRQGTLPLSPARSSRSTSPAATPTTSATRPAAGR